MGENIVIYLPAAKQNRSDETDHVYPTKETQKFTRHVGYMSLMFEKVLDRNLAVSESSLANHQIAPCSKRYRA